MVARAHRSELDPGAFLRRSADVFPERVAVVHGERRLTYRELERRAGALAGALRRRGVEPGDRVAVLAPNSPALLEAHYGVPGAGAALVAINTRLTAADVAAIVRHSGSRLLLVDRELEHLAPAGVETVRIDDTGAADDPYERFLASGDRAGQARPLHGPADEEDTIAIDYTSGTTGRPKGVMYTYRGAYLNALGEVLETGLGPGTVYLWTLPMFHCNGWCFTWAVTAAAGTHVCLRSVDPDAIWDLLRARGCDPLLQRADGAALARQPPERAAARAPGDRHGRRRAPFARPARPDAGAEPASDPRLRV